MSDVELVDLKFVERDPVVVVQFTCQQINCARDRFGNVVEGGPQDVQRVYYYWALQQDDAGTSISRSAGLPFTSCRGVQFTSQCKSPRRLRLLPVPLKREPHEVIKQLQDLLARTGNSTRHGGSSVR